jgi:hypothetical protein
MWFKFWFHVPMKLQSHEKWTYMRLKFLVACMFILHLTKISSHDNQNFSCVLWKYMTNKWTVTKTI